jgi:hypothetical protein
MEIFWSGLATALGSLGFFGGIALLIWAGNKGEAEKKRLEHERELKQREMVHAERLKALELGQTLPDAEVARAQAERARYRAAGAIAVLVPLFLGGAGVGTTPILLNHTWGEAHLNGVLYTVWGVCGLVSLVTVTNCIGVLNRRDKRAAEADRVARSSDRFQDKPPSPIRAV